MSSERNELLAATLSQLGRLRRIAFLVAATLIAFPVAAQMPLSQRAPTEEMDANSASAPCRA